MAVKNAESEIHIPMLRRGTVKLRIIGETPLIQHRMAAKAKSQLLLGGRKKTLADKQASIKHDPLSEYRDAVEMIRGDGPTAIGIRVDSVKAAMCAAALETAGIAKTSAQRLLFMPGNLAPLYGTPMLRMDVVRSSDIARTPDIRTRPCLPSWGAEITIQHILPQLPASSVATLLMNAGVMVGVGDWRQEKGKGSFGSFRVVAEGQDDDEWDELMLNHGREAQEAALLNPEYWDAETEDLMSAFFSEEQRRREFAQEPSKPTKRSKPTAVAAE